MKLVVWITKRFAGIIVQLLLLSFAAFSLLYLTPGSTEQILLGPNSPTPEALEAVRQRYGLDRPYLVQYVSWLAGALHLDLGTSIQTGEQVATLLQVRLAVTVPLAAYALLLVVIIGIPLGLLAGAKEGTGIDRAITAGATFAISAPAFATGIVLLYVFAVTLRWFPVAGSGQGILEMLWRLTLPAIALSLSVIALVIRQSRAVNAVVARSDFVLFARARGVGRPLIWTRYMLRNSSLPLATSIGLIVGFFLTGAVVVERTFSLNGLGTLIVTSISSKDVPVVQAVALLVGIFVLGANLLADVAHMIIDPRVRKAALG